VVPAKDGFDRLKMKKDGKRKMEGKMLDKSFKSL
jgi:hypothetical protein